MKGRKPIPTTVKLQRGNPGHRPVNEREPTHDPLDIATPKELPNAIARAEWNRIAGTLSTSGQCTVVDRAALIAYCTTYAQWLTAVHAKDYDKANKVLPLLFKAATELGITPSARSRIAVVKRDVQDEFAARQHARPTLKLMP